MPAPDGMLHLDALAASGPFRGRQRQPMLDVAGGPVAELTMAPSLLVDRSLAALRRARPAPPDERAYLITRAAELFATATVAGQTVEQYQHAVSRVGGLPISVVRGSTTAVAARLVRAYRSVQAARPAGAVTDWRDPLTRTGRAVWCRRGDVFAVLAAGNHPGTHSLWPEALAMGYRVAIRPSTREPFTPHRLISCLRLAGFGDDQVVLLPTDHDRADGLLRGADLGLVYGGQDVVRKYGARPGVLAQGPGRSKILLTRDVDWRDHLDLIVDSVGHHGGTGCVNTTAVFVEGDPAALSEALAQRFSMWPSLPPQDDKAVLPVQAAGVARRVAGHLRSRAGDAKAWLGWERVVDELGDGSAALRPAVYQLDCPDDQRTGVELSFPCVWVAPWSTADGIRPLRDTLVLTALTRDDRLVDDLVAEPTIRNVYLGDQPTYTIEPGLPHDGYLAEFLMRSKALIREG